MTDPRTLAMNALERLYAQHHGMPDDAALKDALQVSVAKIMQQHAPVNARQFTVERREGRWCIRPSAVMARWLEGGGP